MVQRNQRKQKSHKKTRVRKSQKTKKLIKKHIPQPGPNQCHPRVGRHTPTGGCLPEDILQKSAKVLQIPISAGGEKQNINKINLVKKLTKHLGVKEGNERSLLQKLPISEEEKSELAKKWLRPAMPEEWKNDPDMWLDSNNIRDVMKQYEEAYPSFKFLGPYPIDFASQDPSVQSNSKHCLIDEMCSLDLDKEEIKGKNEIGIIFNLDPHYKNGSHWIATYVNIPKKKCYYFDSYGMKPPKQIYKFMQWLTLQEPGMELGWNGRRFQMKDSECGMYCMYFLDRMIAGEPFLKFCRRAPSDNYMLDLRDWLFST
jgi:hypothetical protein